MRERPRGCLPSSNVRNSLEVLCADSRNTVVVVSTGSTEELSAAYGSVPGCSLCADNGLHVAWSGLHGRWEMAGGVAWELSGAAKRAPMENWRELALSIMSIYSERTNGSFVEQSSSGLAFVYGACDPEFGAMQAKELHAHLSEVLEQEYAVELQLRPGRLHVQPKGVDKGGLLRQAIEAAAPDFVLVLGDDHTDEPAFGALADWLKGSQTVQPSHGGGCTAYGVTVGKKPSRASFFVDDQSAASGLLETLKWGSLRASKTSSESLSAMDVSPKSSLREIATASGGGALSGGGGVCTAPSFGIHGPSREQQQFKPHQGQPWAPNNPMPTLPQTPPIANSSLVTTPTQSAAQPPAMPDDEPLPPGMQSLRKASEGGCPYRQDELTSGPPSYPGSRHRGANYHAGAQLTLTLPSSASVLISTACVVLATLTLRTRSRVRKLLYGLLAASLTVPRWRAALLLILEARSAAR